jgi:hypothetical protein
MKLSAFRDLCDRMKSTGQWPEMAAAADVSSDKSDIILKVPATLSAKGGNTPSQELLRSAQASGFLAPSGDHHEHPDPAGGNRPRRASDIHIQP